MAASASNRQSSRPRSSAVRSAVVTRTPWTSVMSVAKQAATPAVHLRATNPRVVDVSDVE